MEKILVIIAVVFMTTNAFSQIEKPIKWAFAIKKKRQGRGVSF
jgi:thiol:disulfide interchange protein DsbD